jgi:hypothetical protein
MVARLRLTPLLRKQEALMPLDQAEILLAAVMVNSLLGQDCSDFEQQLQRKVSKLPAHVGQGLPRFQITLMDASTSLWA